MTLDEAIQAANSGNVEAMYSLGTFFITQKKISTAMEWLYKGATAGHTPSAKLGRTVSRTLAEVCEKQGDNINAVTYWGQLRECILVIMKDDETSAAECVELMKEMNNATFRAGVAAGACGHMDLAFQYLQEAARDTEYVPGDPNAKKALHDLLG